MSQWGSGHYQDGQYQGGQYQGGQYQQAGAGGESVAVMIDRRRLAILLLAAVVFTVSGVAMVTWPEKFDLLSMPPVVPQVIGIAGTAFFGVLCIPVMLYRLLGRQRPAFVLTSWGVDSSSDRGAIGVVPWTDIAGLSLARVSSSMQVLKLYPITLSNYQGDPSDSRVNRNRQLNQRVLGTPLVVNVSGMTMKPEQILAAAQSLHARALGLPG